MNETSAASFALQEAGELVLARLARYLEESQAAGGPVLSLKPMQQVARELGLERWLSQGGMGPRELDAFLEPYLAHSIRMHHPRNMGHQVSAPHPAAAIGDLIHGAINNPMAIYEMGPSAATTEAVMVRWMLSKIGWCDPAAVADFSRVAGGGGVLTHGGSLANLTALLGARAAAVPEAWEEGVKGDLAILAPANSHYSLARAASILGLGARALIPLETDAREVVRPESLEPALARARSEGKRVMAVVANGCATATGLYDPIEAMADFCEEHGLWFHVDGAHGMSAILSKRDRGLLKGVERANSIIWDMHKMIRVSTLCAAVLFRDVRAMERVFSQEASYLFHEKETYGIDALHYALECTKAGLGLKTFLVVASLGERGLGEYVERQADLARAFHAMLSVRPGFSCPYVPESNILCFRYGDGDDSFQLRLRNALVAEGHHFITSSEVKGRRYLRVTLMVPGSGERELEELLVSVERIAAAI